MQHAKYVRLYADENGESLFEDIEVELPLVEFAPPAPPVNIAPFVSAVNSLWVGIPPKWDGEAPHPTPRQQALCILQGNYEFTASDGTSRHISDGSIILLEDTWGKGHTSRITSDGEGLMIAITMADSEMEEGNA